MPGGLGRAWGVELLSSICAEGWWKRSGCHVSSFQAAAVD
jgi:hypothetical protein